MEPRKNSTHGGHGRPRQSSKSWHRVSCHVWYRALPRVTECPTKRVPNILAGQHGPQPRTIRYSIAIMKKVKKNSGRWALDSRHQSTLFSNQFKTPTH